MSQLNIFEFITDKVETFFSHGAMYALVPEELIVKESAELGDKVISPGQFIPQLGEKKRTSFEMQEGHFLRYCGKAEGMLLFSVNEEVSNYYYAFAYVDRNTLLIAGKHGGRDIRINKLDIL
ncbi:hypothetical protein LIT32_26745 (plasmid) [Bacillus sp. CMF21]|nr:hypothetical protein LIT32_26745 [Bacillus sp. CMF21]